MKSNKTKEMTVAEAVAHTFPIEVLQEAVRLRRLQFPSADLTGKVDPFDTPFSDERSEFDKVEG